MALLHPITVPTGGVGTIEIRTGNDGRHDIDVRFIAPHTTAAVGLLREAIRYIKGSPSEPDVDPMPIIDALAREQGITHELRERVKDLTTRADEPVDPDSDDTRTREHLLAEELRLLGLEKSLRAHLSRTINRAEKAEKERDEWEKIALVAERDADEAEENPRPLTAADITDEMVERARAALSPFWQDWTSRGRIRRILTAALPPEPQRPEGAEDIEALLDAFHAQSVEELADGHSLADYLASCGVRVTGGDS